MQLRFSLAFLNLTIHSSSFFKHYIERYYKPLCVRNRVASEVVSPPPPPASGLDYYANTSPSCYLQTTFDVICVVRKGNKGWQMGYKSLQHHGKALAPVIQTLDTGGGVTWVNFCWVCAASLSEPLLHYSLFYGQL